MHPSPRDELLDLTQRLLDAIAAADWTTYAELCEPSLSAFEPESSGCLVEGLAFHRFYFQPPRSAAVPATTVSSPHVRIMGECAVVSYTRLTQSRDPAGAAHTAACAETRVWQKVAGAWKHVHFHRSSN